MMEAASDGCKIAFLNGIIEEEVYIEELEGFIVHERFPRM